MIRALWIVKGEDGGSILLSRRFISVETRVSEAEKQLLPSDADFLRAFQHVSTHSQQVQFLSLSHGQAPFLVRNIRSTRKGPHLYLVALLCATYSESQLTMLSCLMEEVSNAAALYGNISDRM